MKNLSVLILLFTLLLSMQNGIAQSMKTLDNQSNNSVQIYGNIYAGSQSTTTISAKSNISTPYSRITHIRVPALETFLIVPPNITYQKLKIYTRREQGTRNDMVICEFYNGNNLVKQIPKIPSDGSRKVRFMASADPQFFKDMPDRNKVAERTMEKMWKPVYENPDKYFGQIMAGDLTQMAIQTEWQRYLKIANTMEIYDTWGNHDIENDWTAWTVGDRDAWKEILENITNKWRRFVCNYSSNKLDAHYSWDWRDVHFVNVNLFPGDEAGQTSDGAASIDPKNSLSFLKKDLAHHVGKSGRPVVIVSHYGMDSGISNKWWSKSQKKKFWDAIADYNVILILSGHIHNDGRGYVNWNRPQGKSNGPDSILNLIVGGACEGYYMDIEITENNIKAYRYLKGNKKWEKNWTF